jgi:Zn-dependent alcohol dehydrogenase
MTASSMTERARAFWVTAPGKGEIRQVEIAAPRAGQVLVRALKSGISRGSESLVFTGRVPKS